MTVLCMTWRVLLGADGACDAAGGSELLMGLTITITCVAEVPVFFFTGWLLEAVGVKVVLHGVLAVYILRLLYYSILQHLVRPCGSLFSGRPRLLSLVEGVCTSWHHPEPAGRPIQALR